MQRREGVSARTLALSTAAAELGRVILRGRGRAASVRAALLGNVLATAALVLLVVFVSWNAARLRRPGFVGNCCCAAFLFWYLWELVRTAAMIQPGLLGTVLVDGLFRPAAAAPLGWMEPRLRAV